MAKAKRSATIVLTLNYREARALKELLQSEKWPTGGPSVGLLNEIWSELEDPAESDNE